MANVIIGIHGLANKPEAVVLEEEWKAAIMEGQRNIGYEGDQDFEIIMVYWADFYYDHPLPQGTYAPAGAGTIIRGPDSSVWARVVDFTFRVGGCLWDMWYSCGGSGVVTNEFIERIFRELNSYYDDEVLANGQKAKTALREMLTPLLREQNDNSVTLIAHSMGSIIAYDCLLDLEAEDVTVANFVTIGSPLGLPTVCDHIRDERGSTRSPTNVTGEWHNFSDRQDRVALDAQLADDFGGRNRRPNAPITDHRVCNTFVDGNGKANAHKSFGYLHGPEFSKHLRRCLNQG